jgi:hypothetical protein
VAWVPCALALLTALAVTLTVTDGLSLTHGGLPWGCALAVTNALLGAFIVTRRP